MEREQAKLTASLGGIRDMGGVPDLLFVIDVGKEDLAVLEAKKLGIPVVAVVDTNSSPKGVDYIIPGNDDATRAISLYCDLISRAALDGISNQLRLNDIAESDIPAKSLRRLARYANAGPNDPKDDTDDRDDYTDDPGPLIEGRWK